MAKEVNIEYRNNAQLVRVTDSKGRVKGETMNFSVRLKLDVRNVEKMIKSAHAPSFVAEAIIPIYVSLAGMMRRKSVKVPDPQTYLQIKGYYRIKIGLTTVGGFSVPENGDYNIYFTPMKSANPIGNKQLVSNTEALMQLITDQLKTEKRSEF